MCRYVPADGNRYTVNVMRELHENFPESKFDGVYSANTKFINQLGKSIHFSIDTGQSESIFSSHLFDFNSRHLKNELVRFKNITESGLDSMETPVIKIN